MYVCSFGSGMSLLLQSLSVFTTEAYKLSTTHKALFFFLEGTVLTNIKWYIDGCGSPVYVHRQMKS